MKTPVVSVVMITYGHEHFIRQAVESVLMQQCDFDVELIIANDCSPDNTDAVIKEILATHPRAHKIKYIKHEKNLGVMPNFMQALAQCRGQFIALCEGDDFWIDNQKLQKQYDFLQQNTTYAIHASAARILSQDAHNNTVFGFNNEQNTFSLPDFYTRNHLITGSVMYRNIPLNYPEFFSKLVFGDWFLYVLILEKTGLKAFVSEEVLSVYRVHDKGIMKSLNVIKENTVYLNQVLLIKKYLQLKSYSGKDYQNINNYSVKKYRAQIDSRLYAGSCQTFFTNLKLSKTHTPFKKYLRYLIKK